MNQICKIRGNPEDEQAVVKFLEDVYGWDAKMETINGDRVLMCSKRESIVLPVISALLGAVETLQEIKHAG